MLSLAIVTAQLSMPTPGTIGMSDHLLRDLGLSRHNWPAVVSITSATPASPKTTRTVKGDLIMFSKRLWLIPAALVVLGGIAYAATRSTPPADLDYGLTQLSEQGQYRVTLAPSIEPIPVGKMHGWLVEVVAADGTAVEAEVRFDGGMPQHGHGLPTVPAIVGKDHHGRHIVGGVRFNMPGWWVLNVEVDGAAGSDTATFNLAL